MTTTFVPPLAVSRMIGTYHFEGGGYVAIVADGQIPTELLIEKAQALLDLKREELAASVVAKDSPMIETQGTGASADAEIGSRASAEPERHRPTPLREVPMTDEAPMPCPFCGSQPELMEGHRNHWRIECPRCGVRRAQFANGGVEEDKARAVRSWNTRVASSDRADLVRRVEELEKCLFKLAVASGKLIVSTDGCESLRTERQDTLDAVTEADAALNKEQSNDPG